MMKQKEVKVVLVQQMSRRLCYLLMFSHRNLADNKVSKKYLNKYTPNSVDQKLKGYENDGFLT